MVAQEFFLFSFLRHEPIKDKAHRRRDNRRMVAALEVQGMVDSSTERVVEKQDVRTPKGSKTKATY